MILHAVMSTCAVRSPIGDSAHPMAVLCRFSEEMATTATHRPISAAGACSLPGRLLVARHFITRRISMKQHSFGHLPHTVTNIGFGAWQIGGAWGDVSEADGRDALNAA